MDGLSPSTGDTGILASQLDFLRTSQVIRMVDLAASTIFVWDYIITMDMEIAYVWPGQWSIIKVVYLLQRYLPFIDTVWLRLYQLFATNPSPSMCHVFATTSLSLVFVGLAMSEIILTFRAWAVCDQHKVLTILLPTLFLGCWAPHLLIVIHLITSLEFGNPPVPQAVGCFPIKGDANVIINWILLMVWDTVVAVLMVIPAVKTYRFRGQSALYSTIFAEGIAYYFYLFGLSTVNIILPNVKSLNTGYRFIFVGMARCFHSILTSRVLLHIRARIYRPLDG